MNLIKKVNRFGMSREGRGFTLVELLVVISIISLLSSVVLSTISSAREKARNVQTIRNVRSWVQALNMYYQDNGGYPDATVSGAYICLGEGYASDVTSPYCNPNYGFWREDSAFNSKMDKYINGTPNPMAIPLNNTISGPSGLQTASYSPGTCNSGLCQQPQIYYFLEGMVSCGLPNTTQGGGNGIRFCTTSVK